MSLKKVLSEVNEQDLVDVRYHLFPCTQQLALSKALAMYALLIRSGLLAEVEKAINQVQLEGKMRPSRGVSTLREALGVPPVARAPVHRPSDFVELHGDELPGEEVV